jgi:hypothetical protein
MNENVYLFLKNLLDPEMYGFAVTAEVRDSARVLLGLKKVETLKDIDESNLYTTADDQ